MPDPDAATLDDASAFDQLLDRQRQIWTNLYGPDRAATLVEAAITLHRRHPELVPRDLVTAVDPERDDDYVDFVATRW